MDLSQPVSDFMPRKQGGRGGLLASLGLLFLAVLVASGVGVAGFLGLRLALPDAPPFYAVVIAAVALVVVLQVIARRFEWIMPWYYLLPALLFLITFTIFPVVLTVVLAFSDYAGTRNGELNVSSTTALTAVDGATLTLQNAATLNCRVLRNGCDGVRAVVYASGTLTAVGASLDGDTLTLNEPLPEGRDVTAVEIAAQGFPVQVSVAAAEGDTLTLQNVPPILANAAPADVDLSNLRLTLNRVPIERTMVSLEGDAVTLNEALPAGLEYETIARYNDFGAVGFQNFRRIFAQASTALVPVFIWNIIFAVLTIVINSVAGVFMAVLLNNPSLRFRGIYRTLLIVPWALPSVITIQVWKGFLNTNFGAINRLLALLDLPTYDWLGNPTAAKGAILLVNLWLGLPFMMTATLGALSAIPGELYEAAKIDGANAWRSFWGVTAPLLLTALVPITLTGFAFNFNNFNLIYLLTDGGPAAAGRPATARSTDILISWAYNEAFRSQGGYAYGLGSAIAILIFFITIAVSLINFRVTGALKEEPGR